MPPQPASQNDGFKPKWRQFHPQSTVWIKNPLEYDIKFQVADEAGRRFQYILPAGKVSELPGGSIATLGVKKLVDEMCQLNKETQLSMWDEKTRTAYEDEIIVRFKDAPLTNETVVEGGEVDLSVKEKNLPKVDKQTQAPTGVNEPAFPTLKQTHTPQPIIQNDAAINDIASASVGALDAVGLVDEG